MNRRTFMVVAATPIVASAVAMTQSTRSRSVHICYMATGAIRRGDLMMQDEDGGAIRLRDTGNPFPVCIGAAAHDANPGEPVEAVFRFPTGP